MLIIVYEIKTHLPTEFIIQTLKNENVFIVSHPIWTFHKKRKNANETNTIAFTLSIKIELILLKMKLIARKSSFLFQ
jgi:hypothetical protein